VKIDIADIRYPKLVQPDDKWRIIVEFHGEGLTDKVIKPEVEMTYIRTNKETGKEEELPILVAPAADKAKPGPKTEGQPAPKADDVEVLGKKIMLRPVEPVKFDNGTPPRAEVEFQLDAVALAAAAGKDLTSKAFVDRAKGRKWEIVETVPNAEFRFKARVAKDDQEIFPGKEHVKTGPYGLVVQQRPLRVLLLASAATHEYQFVKNMMVREQDKERVRLAVYLQPPPGRTEAHIEKGSSIAQDAFLLAHFPDVIDRKYPPEDPEHVYDISDYDVIVGFDPDWGQLSDEQIEVLKKWADKGGGLILIGGPINTLQLARPTGAGVGVNRLDKIRDLYPVVLEDIRAEESKHDPSNPWPLKFTTEATRDMEFLKLAEEGEKGAGAFLADWTEFFGKDDKTASGVLRGFYNFYPLVNAKPGAQVLARFAEESAKLKDGQEMPFLVISNPVEPRRVVWLGWGDMYRLRMFHEGWYERFWTKLTRYVGSLNQGKLVKRIRPNFPKVVKLGETKTFEAQIDDVGGNRLNPNAKPEIRIKLIRPGENVNPTPEQKQELEEKLRFLSYKPKSDGWFVLRYKPPFAGEFELELKIEETKDALTHRFTVEAADPERDNTRPDFDSMYRMSSFIDEEVLNRMKEADRKKLLDGLRKPSLEGEQKDDRPRLFFTLANAELIPLCMDSSISQRRDYSDPTPVWDRWPWLGHAWEVLGGWATLGGIVFLLCLEWLTRKLLRLA
jgi:hypothetical protein